MIRQYLNLTKTIAKKLGPKRILLLISFRTSHQIPMQVNIVEPKPTELPSTGTSSSSCAYQYLGTKLKKDLYVCVQINSVWKERLIGSFGATNEEIIFFN